MGRFGFGFGPTRRRRIALSAPAPLLPALANLVFDLNASAITGLADGAALSSWVDSASGITLDTAAGGSAPPYRAAGGAGVGGRAYVDFTAGTKYLTCAAANQGALKTAINSGDYTLVLLISHVATAGNGNTVFTFGNSSSTLQISVDGTRFGMAGSSSTLSAYPWPASTTYGAYGLSSATASPARAGAALLRHYMRGLPFGVAKSVGPSTKVSGVDGTLGVGGRADGAAFGKAYMYRVLAWNRELTPEEMWQVEAYCNAFFGLTQPAVAAGSIVIFDGDSRTAGEGANDTKNLISATFAYQTAAALTVPANAPGCYANFAIGGLTIAQCQAKSAEMAYLAAVPVAKRVWFEEFYNSKALSISTIASQTTAHFAYLRSIFGAGARIIGASPMDHADVNTPPCYDASGDAGTTWGAYVRNNWVALGMDAKVEFTTNAYLGWNQITTAQTSPNGYGPLLPDGINRPVGDGVHCNVAGQLYMAGLVAAAFNALPGF